MTGFKSEHFPAGLRIQRNTVPPGQPFSHVFSDLWVRDIEVNRCEVSFFGFIIRAY